MSDRMLGSADAANDLAERPSEIGYIERQESPKQ
jgi:hypothetical protein